MRDTQHDRRIAERGEAMPVRAAPRIAGPILPVLAELFEGRVHDRLGLARRSRGRPIADLGHVVGEAAHEVADRIDRGERHDVVPTPCEVPQAERADRQPLDHAGDAPAASTTSPSLIAFSNWMKIPVMMSCTSFCARSRWRGRARRRREQGAMLTRARRARASPRRSRRSRSRRCGTAPSRARSRDPAACRSWGRAGVDPDDTASQVSSATAPITADADRPGEHLLPPPLASQPVTSTTPHTCTSVSTTASMTSQRTILRMPGTKALRRLSSSGRRSLMLSAGAGRR